MNKAFSKTRIPVFVAVVLLIKATMILSQTPDRLSQTWPGPDLDLIKSIIAEGNKTGRTAAASKTKDSAVKFTRAGDSGVSKTLAEALGRNPQEATTLKEAFDDIMKGYEQEVAKEGKSNNIAAAFAFFIVANVTAYHDTTAPSDEATEVLFNSLQNMMSASAGFAKLTNTEKQQMHDWFVCMAGFVLANYTDAKNRSDASALANIRQLADYSTRLILGTSLEKLNISSIGTPSFGAGETSSSARVSGTNLTGISKSTTTFNDGWVAKIDNDFVRLTKGNMDVYLFYPILLTDETRSLDTADYAWNSVVVPKFSITAATKFEDPVPDVIERLYYIEGTGSEKTSGRSGFIAMKAVTGAGVMRVILALATNRQAYTAGFPTPKDLSKLLSANRFAIAASDLVGKWNDSGGTAIGYYNTNTGAYAGMGTAATSDQFVFAANGTYQTSHASAVSKLGSLTTGQSKDSGSFSVSDWELTINGKAGGIRYSAYFEAVKNGRVLHLTQKGAEGMQYHLVMIK